MSDQRNTTRSQEAAANDAMASADDTHRKEEHSNDQHSNDPTSDMPSSNTSVAARVKQLETELKHSEERLLRSQAELENFRRRAARQMQDERRFANQPLIADMLPALDNIERAILAAEKQPEGSGLLEGFKMVHQQLLTTLKQHGCTPIEAVGMPFDPQQHEAISQSPSDQFAAGNVAFVALQGYKLHDRVVRPAQVIVSTGPSNDHTSPDS